MMRVGEIISTSGLNIFKDLDSGPNYSTDKLSDLGLVT